MDVSAHSLLFGCGADLKLSLTFTLKIDGEQPTTQAEQ